jgi:transposase
LSNQKTALHRCFGSLRIRSRLRPKLNEKIIYTSTLLKIRSLLALQGFLDSSWGMIRAGFMSPEDRADLIALVREGSAAHRLARRANTLVLLDDGWRCEEIAKILFVDDDTIRSWFRLFEEDGIDGLAEFGHEGSACQLSGAQQEKLKAWIAAALPRSTRQVGGYIEKEFGVVDGEQSPSLLAHGDDKNRKYAAVSRGFVAGGPGFEPKSTESESLRRVLVCHGLKPGKAVFRGCQ